jgi:hypothetical protein
MRFIETLAADHDYEAQHTQLLLNGHGARDAARAGIEFDPNPSSKSLPDCAAAMSPFQRDRRRKSG